MKRFTYNIAAKSAAIVLSSIIFAFICILCIGMILGGAAGMYTDSKASVLKNALSDSLYNGVHEIIYDFVCERDLAEYDNTNFLYIITDKSGQIVASNTDALNSEYSVSENFVKIGYGSYDFGDSVFSANYYAQKYIISVSVNTDFPQTDHMWFINKVINTAYSMRYSAIVFVLFGAIILIFLVIFLFCSAGHQDASGEAKLNYIDKVPFDIFTLFFGVIALLELYCIGEVHGGDMVIVVILAASLIANFPLLLWYFLSLATRIKVGGLFKNTVIYKMSAFFIRCILKILRKINWLAKSIPLVYKTALITAVITFAEFFVIITFEHRAEGILMLWIVEKIITIPLVLYCAIMFRRLKNASEKIAQGNLDYSVNLDDMPSDFKDFAHSLNNINLGMQSAVEQRVKSERFKTELITNVSHDIKTPLTSIINYVDLIKKEKIDDAKINEYISVLDRQSVRLKKLIEDLIEASKASTGNIALNMQECELDVLLTQAIGEYSEKFESKQLTTVIEKPDAPIKVWADGRYLWRVFDNLLNNVFKYALNNTRVYFNICVTDKGVVTVIKNISEHQLNVSGEELLERFVRGDSSRNTEGNGLGLSIARSLVELQNGRLDISTDGDLFKVSLTLSEYILNAE